MRRPKTVTVTLTLTLAEAVALTQCLPYDTLRHKNIVPTNRRLRSAARRAARKILRATEQLYFADAEAQAWFRRRGRAALRLGRVADGQPLDT